MEIRRWPRWALDEVRNHPSCTDLRTERALADDECIAGVSASFDAATEGPLKEEEARMAAVVRFVACLNQLEAGDALLLVDGVDEDGTVHGTERLLFEDATSAGTSSSSATPDAEDEMPHWLAAASLDVGEPTEEEEPVEAESTEPAENNEAEPPEAALPVSTAPVDPEPSTEAKPLEVVPPEPSSTEPEAPPEPSSTEPEPSSTEPEAPTDDPPVVLEDATVLVHDGAVVARLEGRIPPALLHVLAVKHVALPAYDGGARVHVYRLGGKVCIATYVVDPTSYHDGVYQSPERVATGVAPVRPTGDVARLHRLRRLEYERR